MIRFLAALGGTLVVFTGMDFVWLTTTSKPLYQAQIGPLLLTKPKMGAAVAFYALYMIGLVVLVVLPAADIGGWRRAALTGALFGLVAYATYDLTNLATLKGFTLTLSLADMAWGAVVTGVACAAGCAIAQRVG